MTAESKKNKRAGFRIDDVLPVSIVSLTVEEYQCEKGLPGHGPFETTLVQDLLRCEVAQSDGKAGQISSRLGRILEGIDSKLNYLVSVEMLRDIRRRGLKEVPVNFSVTGLRFRTRASYKQGAFIKISLMLPLLPPVSMELLADVQRVEPKGESYNEVAAMFRYRSREEENKVTQYVYKRQREMIRMGSEQLRANQ
jgi:hypothetical protein